MSERLLFICEEEAKRCVGKRHFMPQIQGPHFCLASEERGKGEGEEGCALGALVTPRETTVNAAAAAA